MKGIYTSVFVQSTRFILLITACAKLYTVFTWPVKWMHLNDPILLIPNWLLLAIAALTEFTLIFLIARRTLIYCHSLLAFSFIAMAYRAFAAVQGSEVCPCTGTASFPKFLNPYIMQYVLWGVLFFFIIGAITVIAKTQSQAKLANEASK